MLSSLPDLAPRDSHALWYVSSTRAVNTTSRPDSSSSTDHNTHQAQQSSQRRSHHQANRAPLVRLRADELLYERRKLSVANYGSSWLKPPGVSKSLHQRREEARELEEHNEAMRREALAQELAAAEAGNELLQGEGMDGEMEEMRDLDDDIPEAEVTGLDAEDLEDDMVDEEQAEVNVMSQRMPEDVYREAIARGDDRGQLSDEEDASQMLQEEDLVRSQPHILDQDVDMGMDMDGDLDGDIPEAEPEEYEHTDTEEELSSSEDEASIDHRHLTRNRTLGSSIVRSDGTQNSLDLSAMDLRSSSISGSSPGTRGQASSGRSRRQR